MNTIRKAARSVLIFTSAQMVTQALALVGGLLVVRIVSVEDYAVYAFFGALIGAAAVTSDFGVSSATTTLLSRARKREDFAEILSGAVSARLFLGIISTVVMALIFLSNTSIIHEVETAEKIFLVAAIVLIVLFQGSATLARAVLSSQGKLSVINLADPFAGTLRVTILSGAFLLVSVTPLSVPIIAWLLSTGLIAIWLNRHIQSVRLWPPSRPPHEMIAMLVPLLPGHLYFLLSGLVPVLAMGARSGPEVLAAYWALSRLGMILFSMAPVLNYVAHPFVSRGGTDNFLERSAFVLFAAAAAALLAVTSGYVFPDAWLLLLGPNYSNLVHYVWLALAVAGLRFLSDTFYRMMIAGGETGRQYLAVAAGIAAQLAAAYVSPMNDLGSIYLFVAAGPAAEIIVYIFLYFRSIRVMRNRNLPDG